jgi:DNA polymerase-3 subunit epsilon
VSGVHRNLIVAVLSAALACGLALISGLILLGLEPDQDGGRWLALAIVASLGAAVFLLWYVFDRIGMHFRNLERLHGAVVVLGGLDAMADLPGEVARDEPELGRIADAILVLSRRRAGEHLYSSRRMEGVLAARGEAIVVMTEQGQVSLVNHAAMDLLGSERVRVGTSVFAALERNSVLQALALAHREGRPVEVTLLSVDGEELGAQVSGLGPGEGGVLFFAAATGAFKAVVEHDLSLHDRPPAVAAADRDTPLAELPALVLDCETTGLDVQRERIVSLGAVRLHGGRIYPGVSFDRLINPGVPIPALSRSIHGISDDMVREAPDFPTVFAELAPLLAGCVVIGHNIAFDLAMLKREFELAGLRWEEPLFLDSLLLASGLDPKSKELGLETLAAVFGVDVHGRHTALGDSLVTAEIYRRMLPRLADLGIRTLGDAISFSGKATHLIAKQDASGW